MSLSLAEFIVLAAEAGIYPRGGTPGDGTVTEVDTNSGLTGGPITSTGTIGVAPHGITFGLFQQIPTVTLLGNPTGGTANIQGITLGTNLSFSGSVLNATGGGGIGGSGTANQIALFSAGTTLTSVAGLFYNSSNGRFNVGTSNTNTGTNSVTIGINVQNTANGSIVIGNNCSSSHNNSFVANDGISIISDSTSEQWSAQYTNGFNWNGGPWLGNFTDYGVLVNTGGTFQWSVAGNITEWDGATLAVGGNLTCNQIQAGNVFGVNFRAFGGNVGTAVAGFGLAIQTGANARAGTTSMSSGIATIANTSVTANTYPFWSVLGAGSVIAGTLSYALNPGTGFTITSTINTDHAATIIYHLVEASP